MRHQAQLVDIKAMAPVNLDSLLANARSAWRCTRAKPDWVVREVMKLQALLPNAGSRKIAEIFNRQHLERHGESVSHSTVRRIVIKHGAEIARLRADMRNRITRSIDKNEILAMDLTVVTDADKMQRLVLGVLDHGTRACLALSSLKDKRTLSILLELASAMKRFGVPKRLRVDNEAVFTSRLMKYSLTLLGVKLQRIQPMSPWQNGRVERFFGTFKESIRQIIVTGTDDLQVRLVQFRAFYNHVRVHQHVNGRTPAEVWDGVRKRYGDGELVTLWGGVLAGWHFAKRE